MFTPLDNTQMWCAYAMCMCIKISKKQAPVRFFLLLLWLVLFIFIFEHATGNDKLTGWNRVIIAASHTKIQTFTTCQFMCYHLLFIVAAAVALLYSYRIVMFANYHMCVCVRARDGFTNMCVCVCWCVHAIASVVHC